MVPNLSKHLMGPQPHAGPSQLPPPPNPASASIPPVSSTSRQGTSNEGGMFRSVVPHGPITAGVRGCGLSSHPVDRPTAHSLADDLASAMNLGSANDTDLASQTQSQSDPESSQSMASRESQGCGKTVSSSDLMHPVPLKMLIQHNILQAGPGTLTCTILVCLCNDSYAAPQVFFLMLGSFNLFACFNKK